MELRADSGFAVPRLYAWCEAQAVTSTIWLLDTLRRWLGGTDAAAQFDTLRLRLLKIGGRVWELVGRVRLALASSHPGEPLWLHLAARPARR